MSHNGLHIEVYPLPAPRPNPPPPNLVPGADITRSLLPATAWQAHISQHRDTPFPEHPARVTFLEEATFAYLRLEKNYLAKSAECRAAVQEKMKMAKDVNTMLGAIEKKVLQEKEEKEYVVQQREILLKMLASKGETSESVQAIADPEMGNASIPPAVSSRHILDSLAQPNMMQGKMLAKLKYGRASFQELGINGEVDAEEVGKEEGELEEG